MSFDQGTAIMPIVVGHFLYSNSNDNSDWINLKHNSIVFLLMQKYFRVPGAQSHSKSQMDILTNTTRAHTERPSLPRHQMLCALNSVTSRALWKDNSEYSQTEHQKHSIHPTLVPLTFDASVFKVEQITHNKLTWEESGYLENVLDMLGLQAT